MTKLTAPLKTWSDGKGGILYRLGDLPVGIKFKLAAGGSEYEVISYSRSSRTGKRQVKNMDTKQVVYEYCTKKVYVVE